MSEAFNKCPRQISPQVWEYVCKDYLDPTTHTIDTSEEDAIEKDAIFWLDTLGVERPILLSQDAPTPPEFP